MRISILLLLAAVLLGCGPKKIEAVSYAGKVQPILNSRCVSCHSAQRAEGHIVLSSYTDLMASRILPGRKPVVIPGDHLKSWLFILCSTNQAHYRMPPDTSNQSLLPKEEITLIADWIKQGAMNN
jgi:uncharacterized membrane protein